MVCKKQFINTVYEHNTIKMFSAVQTYISTHQHEHNTTC